jgi:hypothetical protein
MNENFSVGTVLGTGFRVWLRNIIPFTLITVVIYAPLIIWAVTAVSGEMTLDRIGGAVHWETYGGALSLLLNVFVSATLTYGVVMELQGKRASMLACVTTGFARLFPVLGVGILTFLAVAGGCICLIVPGIIIMCMLYVATPASVIERPGVMGALRRSRELTAGHKGQIFGILFLLGLLGFAARKIVAAMLPSGIDAILAALPKFIYIELALQILLGTLGSVMAAVAYYYLRKEKEGTGAEELASVFA